MSLNTKYLVVKWVLSRLKCSKVDFGRGLYGWDMVSTIDDGGGGVGVSYTPSKDNTGDHM